MTSWEFPDIRRSFHHLMAPPRKLFIQIGAIITYDHNYNCIFEDITKRTTTSFRRHRGVACSRRHNYISDTQPCLGDVISHVLVVSSRDSQWKGSAYSAVHLITLSILNSSFVSSLAILFFAISVQRLLLSKPVSTDTPKLISKIIIIITIISK